MARKETKLIEGLRHKAKRVLFLTGTPIMNKPAEAYPLLSAIAPETFGDFWKYHRRFCDAHRGAYGWDFSGATHMEEFQELLRSTCMVRRLKKDVLKELPAKRRQTVILPQNGSAKVIADESKKLADVLAELAIAAESDDPEDYEHAQRKARVAFTAMSATRLKVGLAKVKPAIEHIEDALENTAKVIVFFHHKEVGAKLAEHFGRAAVMITGDTPNEDRQVAVDRFQTDPTVRVFLGSLMACREGLTLTAATVVIFIELDWVPANMNQAEDRAHRIGQTGSVLVQHLVFQDSLDERISELLLAKQEIADRALDNATTVEVSADAVEAKAKREKRQAANANLPPVPEGQRQAAHQAMRMLAGMCDGAATKDGAGFSRIDVAIGHKMARMTRLSDGQARLAARLATKYRGQLDSELVTAAGGKA